MFFPHTPSGTYVRCLLLIVFVFCISTKIHAQLVQPGFAVVTCEADDNGGAIDPDGYVVGIIDIRDPAGNGATPGVNWAPPMNHNEANPGQEWTHARLGTVYGVELDNDRNIYVAAAGIYPTVPNSPVPTGQASEFGPGGGGAIYKLDATDGSISTFATLPNAIFTESTVDYYPGLGQLAYDKIRNQFFVSNFDDGLIYRVTSAGATASTFDHGVAGRGAASLSTIADVPAQGWTPRGRRVWAVTYNVASNRLFYSVWWEDCPTDFGDGGCNGGTQEAAEANEVWSVGLTAAGEFIPGSAQLEFAMPTWNDPNNGSQIASNPVSDLDINDDGTKILVSERTMSEQAPLMYPEAHGARLFQYNIATGTQEFEHAVGAGIMGANANGAAYAYAYDAGGNVGTCEGSILASGDGLRFDGGPPAAYYYGMQIAPTGALTQANVLSTAYMIDYDINFGPPLDKLLMGEVDFYGDCLVPLPVELGAFEAKVEGQDVLLTWQTRSEQDNVGFAVEHYTSQSQWEEIGFVTGAGTSMDPQHYSYRAKAMHPGRHLFRLKQVDFDGAFGYSSEVEAVIEVPARYHFEPAYPNPFNPETTVRFAVAGRQPVSLVLYDVTGRVIRTVFEGMVEANTLETSRIDASGLSSGMYVLELKGIDFSAVQKIVLHR